MENTLIQSQVTYKSSHFATMDECLLICNIVNRHAGCRAATISIDSNGNYWVDAAIRRDTMRKLAAYAKDVLFTP